METEDMNPEDIFHKALEITDADQRVAYLDDACRGNDKVRAEVEELLKAHEEAGDFMESLADSPGVTLDSSTSIEGPGTKIGHYELLELIGEGGMGLVYLAEQKEPVRRRTALKVIKPGMDSKQVIARFDAERQVLALLDHPNIAHVFDAGTSASGRPYFVMEYVKGYAHQKGIIHRDIKPSNILVTVQGDKPVPKIIDFGIAKALTHSFTEGTLYTYQGQLLGTPEYMSPEQVDMATQDIDTRSDIYSLGVLLYELLTGTPPFDRQSLKEGGLVQLQRTIREVEPAHPSSKLTGLGQEACEKSVYGAIDRSLS
ncbi:MAG: serine/threonine protein kinase [Planctomycetota bacterium]|jgi:serine/threonine protein kinase